MAEIKAKKISQLQEINSIRDSEKYLNSYLLLSYNNGPEDRDNYKIRADHFMSYVYDDMKYKANITILGEYVTQTYLQSYYADLDDLSYCKKEVISYLYHELDIAYINEQINNVKDIVDEVSENLEDFTNSQYANLEFHFTHVTATAIQDSELDRMFKDDTVILKLNVENGYEISESTVQVDGVRNSHYEPQTQILVINGVEKNIIDVYAAARAKRYNIVYKLGRHIQENPNLGHMPQYVMYDNVARISMRVDTGYDISYINVNDAEYWITNGCELWVRVLDSVAASVDTITVIVQATKTEYSYLQDSIADVYNELNALTPKTAYYDVNQLNTTIIKNDVAYSPYSIALHTGRDVFTVKPNTGYILQDVVINGAEYTFDPQTGVVIVENANETIIKMLCVAVPKKNIVTTSATNATVLTHFPSGAYTHEAYAAELKTVSGYKIGSVTVKNTEWFLWNDSRVVFVPNGQGVVEIIVKGVRDNAWSAEPIDDQINALRRNIEDLQRQIDYYHSDTVQVLWKTQNVVLSERPDYIGDDSYEITITPENGYSLPASIDVSGATYEYTVGTEYATLRLLRNSSSLVTIIINGVPNNIQIVYAQTQFTYVEKPTSVKMGETVAFSLKYSSLKYKDPICVDGSTTVIRDGAIVNGELVSVEFSETRNIVTATYTIRPTGQGTIYVNPVEESFVSYYFGIVGDESLFVMQQGTELDGQVMEYPTQLRADVELSDIPQFVTTNGYNPFSEMTYETYIESQNNNYKYIIIPQEFISIEDEIYIKYDTTKYKIVFDPYKGYNDHGVPQPNGNSKSVFDTVNNVEGYIYDIGEINTVKYYAIYFDLTDSDTEADFALTIISE